MRKEIPNQRPERATVDPFFLPLPLVRSTPGENVSLNVQRLEQYLDVALCLLRKLAEHLQRTLGPDALAPELTRFLASNDVVSQISVISQIDALVKHKKQTECVRLFRELFCITWDQAFDLHDCWPTWDQGKKLRCLQTAELRKLFFALERPTLLGEQSSHHVPESSKASTPNP
jgi:hypothetical protein